jgi:hypothetical protein
MRMEKAVSLCAQDVVDAARAVGHDLDLLDRDGDRLSA